MWERQKEVVVIIKENGFLRKSSVYGFGADYSICGGVFVFVSVFGCETLGSR